jgi:hypothetical protein
MVLTHPAPQDSFSRSDTSPDKIKIQISICAERVGSACP